MAWIGDLDAEGHVLEPVASSGHVEGDLDAIRIDTLDPKHSIDQRCSASDGRSALCNDMSTMPAINRGATRHCAADTGRRPASLSKSNDQTTGAFCLYAGETGFFAGDELAC